MTDTRIDSPTELHYRIWGEFHTMPGLRLTADQVCRLVGGNRAEIVEALKGLVDAGVLRQIGPYYVRADFGRYTA
jgi:beta-phosphoglucomutase-like phosphatase (HAD superfamily)